MALSNPSATRTIVVSKAQYGPYSNLLQFTVNLNRAPDRVVLLSPEEDGIFLDKRPYFIWRVPNDQEGDKLHFQIQIDTSVTFSSQIGAKPLFAYDSYVSNNGFAQPIPRDSGTGQASFQIPIELQLRSVYYWRVRAFDDPQNNSNIRYGEWSLPRKLTIGVIATQIKLEASRTFLPAQGQTSTITASFIDRLEHIDTAFNQSVTFGHTQPSLGRLAPIRVTAISGIAKTALTAAGVEGATHILADVTPPLPYNDLVISSVEIAEAPVLIYPKNGSRLASNTKPILEWMVPNSPDGFPLHFKVEIYKTPIFNTANLIYLKESKDDLTGFKSRESTQEELPVQPLSANCLHTIQTQLPDGKYWWRVTPWDTGLGRYKTVSGVFVFSMPNEMTIVSKPLSSNKPITQAVMMANTTIDIGLETNPATVEYYITNMAKEPELNSGEENSNKLQWINVTEQVKTRSKIVFPNKTVPRRGWAVALKTVIKANDSTGRITFNGHGVVFDGDYQELMTEDYIGVLSAFTPISFQAIPSADGASIGLTWAYADLNTSNKRIIDKFIIEVYNPVSGAYEPYDGGTGEILA